MNHETIRLCQWVTANEPVLFSKQVKQLDLLTTEADSDTSLKRRGVISSMLQPLDWRYRYSCY